jgi:hypothetical protein
VKTVFRIEQGLLEKIRLDLARPHAFAHERVGFIACKVGPIEGGFLLLAQRYLPVADDDYEDGHDVGAMMGPGAIRKALQVAYNDHVSMVHVHCHDHRGRPGFSRVDLSESARFVPNFWNVQPKLPHGMAVLSRDAMAGMAWDPVSKQSYPMDEMAVIGRPLRFWRTAHA